MHTVLSARPRNNNPYAMSSTATQQQPPPQQQHYTPTQSYNNTNQQLIGTDNNQYNNHGIKRRYDDENTMSTLHDNIQHRCKKLEISVDNNLYNSNNISPNHIPAPINVSTGGDSIYNHSNWINRNSNSNSNNEIQQQQSQQQNNSLSSNVYQQLQQQCYSNINTSSNTLPSNGSMYSSDHNKTQNISLNDNNNNQQQSNNNSSNSQHHDDTTAIINYSDSWTNRISPRNKQNNTNDQPQQYTHIEPVIPIQRYIPPLSVELYHDINAPKVPLHRRSLPLRNNDNDDQQHINSHIQHAQFDYNSSININKHNTHTYSYSVPVNSPSQPIRHTNSTQQLHNSQDNSNNDDIMVD